MDNWVHKDKESLIAAIKKVIPDELYERAKKIKFTDGQLACFTEPKSLETTCDRIKLQAMNMANRRAE